MTTTKAYAHLLFAILYSLLFPWTLYTTTPTAAAAAPTGGGAATYGYNYNNKHYSKRRPWLMDNKNNSYNYNHKSTKLPTLFLSLPSQNHLQYTKLQHDNDTSSMDIPYNGLARFLLRGGGRQDDIIHNDSPSSDNSILFDPTIRSVLQILATLCRTLLPPCVAIARAITIFYTNLPIDAILAQSGLVYCFAGGYFPTLFAAIQAAQHCGWENALQAIRCMMERANVALQACEPWCIIDSDDNDNINNIDDDNKNNNKNKQQSKGTILTQKTLIILATIDPIQINQAVAAFYTTWLGVSTVLEREFAKTITLTVTIGDYLRPTMNFMLAPLTYRFVPKQYHSWVPVLLGWGCKAVAMSVAWRIQRFLTAYSSAMAGGLMFSRSIFRLIRKRQQRYSSRIPNAGEKYYLEELLGFMIAGLGLYSQIGHGLSFKVPFPLNLLSWPFELAERFIQWAISKKREQVKH